MREKIRKPCKKTRKQRENTIKTLDVNFKQEDEAPIEVKRELGEIKGKFPLIK